MKKLTLKKSITPLAFAIILFSVISTAKAQTSNFTGTWRRNDTQSNAGGISINSVPVSLEISQDAKSIAIKRTSKNGQGEVTSYTEQLTFDKKVAETITPSQLKRSSSILWSDDHKQLIENSTSRDDNNVIKQIAKQTFSLDSEGKVLKVLVELTINDQTVKMEQIFDKQ